MFVPCLKRCNIDFIKDTQILHPNYITNGSNWHTFLALHCLDIKGISVQLVKIDEELWNKVNTNVKLFYESFVCPALLELKPITCCGNCDAVLLEDSEMEEEVDGELNSIQHDSIHRFTINVKI